MLGWFKRSGTAPPEPTLHDTLFGDLPLGSWGAGKDGEPWTSFAKAAAYVGASLPSAARETLLEIAARPGLESRHYLQAWHALRSLDAAPPANEAKHVYGVVVEVALDRGTDVVAAYEDHTARYLNFSGAAIIWDRRDPSIDDLIDALLRAAQPVVARIGPWDRERPGPPARGEARINFLTPSGLHFGQAPFNALAADALAGPVIAPARVLMQALMHRVP